MKKQAAGKVNKTNPMNVQYEKFELIGTGRHSLVYEGHDHGPLDRAIAIKDLADPFKTDSRRVQDFIGEARFLANLDYEHLLKVYDVDPASNLVITELLEGSLDRLIESRGPMTSDRVRSVVQQVLKALNYLHKNSVLYGSIRPSKLLYSDRGKVKLGGFEPIQHDIVPKPEVEKYVAPETLDTEFGEIGPPLDFYCLGFAALELLLGNKFDQIFPVISGDKSMSNVGWLRWHGSKEELPPVKKLVPRVADDLAVALDAMLRKNVSERPQTAVQAISMLQDVDPIPVIEGVEQSIAMGKGRRSAARTSPRSHQNSDAETDPNRQAEMSGQFLKVPADPPKIAKAKTSKLRHDRSRHTTADEAAIPLGKPQAGESPKSAVAKAARVKRPRDAEKLEAGQYTKRKRKSFVGRALKWMTATVLLAGLGYGLWWTYEHDPMNWFAATTLPVPEVRDVAVQFEFEPDGIGSVQVMRDGEPVTVDGAGNWLLPAGDHQLMFLAGEYESARKIRVDRESDSFLVTLNRKAPAPKEPVETAPGDFEIRFTIDPPSATLLLDGDPLPVENGFAHARLSAERQGQQAVLRVEQNGYQPLDESIDLVPSSQSGMRHVALNPLLAVEPEDAIVMLDGQPLQRTQSGRYVLPRQDIRYDLVVTREGYTRFEGASLTFDQLKARGFTIELRPDLDHIFQIGKQALENREFDDAINNFSIVLTEDHAKYLTAYLLRGKALLNRAHDDQDAHEAEEDLTAFLSEAESTATDTEKAEAHWLRGRIHRSEGELNSAADDYRSSLRWQPDRQVQQQLVSLLLERADQYLQTSELDSAIGDLEEVRELAPETSQIDSRLAAICFQRGQQRLQALNLGAARIDFDRAIDLVKDQAAYYVARGECRGRNSEILEGIQDYTTGIELSDAPSSNWYVARGLLYRQDKQREKALQDFEKAIQVDTENSTALIERAHLHREDFKDFNKAIADFRSALESGYENAQQVQLAIGDTHVEWSDSRIQSNDFLQAIEQLRSALEQFRSMRDAADISDQEKVAINTRIREVLPKLGLCYRARSDWEQGIAVYTEAIRESNNTDPEAYAGRGKCLKSVKQYAESEQDLKKALQLNPKYNNARLYLAQLYILWGQERARNRFNAAPRAKSEMKELAVRNLRSAVLELENLIKADSQPRYYDLMVEAWKWLNVLDNSPDNAETANEWERRRREFNSNR